MEVQFYHQQQSLCLVHLLELSDKIVQDVAEILGHADILLYRQKECRKCI
nr:MAG TPA: hypothetical protein [Bacteriophage sp.]